MKTAMSNADRTYSRVLRAFRTTPAASYRRVGRKLDLAPSTVGLQVERAVREGMAVRGVCDCCGAGIVTVLPGEGV